MFERMAIVVVPDHHLEKQVTFQGQVALEPFVHLGPVGTWDLDLRRRECLVGSSRPEGKCSGRQL